MKSFIVYLISLFLIPSGWIYGQSVLSCSGACLLNGTFAAACPDVVQSCDYINGSCSDGWYISHGTPQFFANPGNTSTPSCPNPFSAIMWSQYELRSIPNELQGEGIYTYYPFLAGVTYNVRVNFNISETQGSPLNGSYGTVNLYATSGLTPGKLTGCGEVLPNPSKALIGNYNIISPGTTSLDLSFTFTPAQNTSWNQLWVYPLAAVNTISPPYITLSLTSVFVCPNVCTTGTEYYNSGVLPQVAAANDIYAGSSAGTGGLNVPVSLASTFTTVLMAGDAVYLQPQFEPNISGYGSFAAAIVPCIAKQGLSIPDIYDTIRENSIPVLDSVVGNAISPVAMYGRAGNSLGVAAAASRLAPIRVYPTVGNGTLHVAGSSEYLSNAVLTVVDESGRVVFRSYNTADTNITLDLGNLSNGLYFLQIRNPSKTISQKIIINK